MKKFFKVCRVILLIGATLFLAMLIIVPFLTTGSMLKGRHDYDYINPSDYDVQSTQIMLTTDDDLKIATYFVEVDEPKGCIVLVSGIDNPPVCSFYGYARMFEKEGFSTLLVEMRAHGESQGEDISAGVEEWLDVKAGVDYICTLDEYKDLPIIAYGTSMGAATVIIAGAQVDEIDAVISASAYSKWSDVVYYSMTEQMGAPVWYSKIQKPFFDLHLGLKYGLGKMKYNPVNQIKDLDKPILLMHSEGDSQVPYACFEKLRDAAPKLEEVFIYTLEGDYHFVCTEEKCEDDEEFVSHVIDFLQVITDREAGGNE